ncbi:hypothetical protein [Tardiphaga sp. 813_E8_N1_3]|uniref:hypothetical protein n=1 Tax=Tardiphaga sp. 813_E8_N1_3 TaxID=3240760 RepID=UPI003F22DAC3
MDQEPGGVAGAKRRSIQMKRTLIRYRTKDDAAAENQRLIENVFRELQAKAPEGVRYMVLRLGDGSFVHLVEDVDGRNSVPELDAFKLFQSGIKERCAEPPVAHAATIVGNYRMLDPQ